MDPPTLIAIVGLGCRFSGAADSPDKLWEVLSGGKSTWSPVPENRWRNSAFFDADPEQQGMHNVRGGHFLEGDVAAFDANFWRLAPADCEAMDPQHRIQLEVAYEALENAGIKRQDFEGSDTAVFVATFSEDYRLMQHKDLDDIPKYHTVGIGTGIAANRISYQLDLRGPSVTIDTGCSGSLVAVHQACQSLRTGECRMALAGGVNLMLSPDQIITMSLMRCFSEEGKCYSFDARGTGYGRGEGAAMVVLKRLDDAVRDGDSIRAVIRNTGVNQDGRTNGIMVPSSAAQQSLIESVYRQAQLDPMDTPFVEAHGTGTAVGDPLEAAAIQEAFRKHKKTKTPLYLGSLKSNIGHLESASGIAGLIKGVLMMEHGKIPATIGIESMKPNLQLDEFGIEIPNRLIDWPSESIRRVSLNNFGYGGTNAHAILEAPSELFSKELGHSLSNGITKSSRSGIVSGNSNGIVSGNSNGVVNGNSNGVVNGNTNGIPNGLSNSIANGIFDGIPNGALHTNIGRFPLPPLGIATTMVNANQMTTPETLDQLQLIPLSANSTNSFQEVAEKLRNWASTQSPYRGIMEDLAFTLTSRRSLMRFRVAIPARSLQGLASQIGLMSKSPQKAIKDAGLIFAFTGQGAQWYAMGRELIGVKSAFQASIQRSNDMLMDLGATWSLTEELLRTQEKSKINESELAQSATCAIQIALVDLLAEIGVEPHAVMGHSSGEIAAAYAAGVIDQVTALAIAFYRGNCSRNVAKRGAMLAVGLGEAEVELYLDRVKSGRAVIACANSPSSTTISGDANAIDEIEAVMTTDGKFVRRLMVDTAYHSHHMLEVADQYRRRVVDLACGPPCKAAFFSSVTGERASTTISPLYWVENLISKVRFVDATRQAIQLDTAREPSPAKHVIVEIGPHNALAGPIRQTLASIESGHQVSYHATLSRGRDALETFANLAAELLGHGCSVNLSLLNTILSTRNNPRVLNTLPPYPWDHSRRYWHESRLSKDYRFRKFPYHDLLGTQIPGQNTPRPAWRHILSVARLPWLKEHMIDGEIIFPASGYIAMVLEAMRQVTEYGKSGNQATYELKDISFVAPLVLSESGAAIDLRLQLDPVAGSTWDDFVIRSTEKDGTTTEHCRGSVIAIPASYIDEVEGVREKALTIASSVERLRALQSLPMVTKDTSTFYKELRTRGNVYGKHFACMEDLKIHAEQALGRFRTPEISECMPSATMRPHLIHPAIVDAFLHPSVALADANDAREVVVTAAISSFKISASVKNTAGTVFNSCTRRTDRWSQSSTMDIDVFQFNDIGDPEPVVQIQGLRLQALGTLSLPKTPAPENTNYLMKWGIDADYLTAADIDPYQAEPEEVSSTQADKLSTLNQASAIYIGKCLAKLDKFPSLQIKENFQRLVLWMHRFRASGDYADLVSEIPQDCTTDKVLDMARTLGVEGEILANIGENMVSIVSGKIDPLSLFTERDLLWRLYADDASVRCYGFAIEYLHHLVFKKPYMRVLEIGAGTGGATEPILQALSTESRFPFQSYDFTDVSAAFFERSQCRLQKWEKHITFRKLDLQDDPLGQGFESGSYDLIIASNVLHVAHSIDTALSRIKGLLKLGGRILMIETTRTVPFLNTAIGVLPGWWGAEDGRIDGPLLSEEQWDAALARNGLGGNAVVAKDFSGPAHRCAMIVSKPLSLPQIFERHYSNLEILISPYWSGGYPAVVDELLESLKGQGCAASSVPLNDVRISAEQIYIFLDNGTSPILGSKNSQTFKAITSLVSNPISLFWVSVQEDNLSVRNPEKGLVSGFARAARAENKSLQLLTLDVQDTLAARASRIALVDAVCKFEEAMRSRTHAHSPIDQDRVLKNGQLYIPRVVSDESLDCSIAKSLGTAAVQLQTFHQDGRPLRLSLNKARIIDNIEFEIDSSIQGQVLPDQVEIIVQAHGINFKDVLIAGGHPKRKLDMAGEFAGTVTQVGSRLSGLFSTGDRVCGFGGTPYASRVRVLGDSIAKIPASLSITAAASIPVVFATAYHALVDIARLQKGQSVLIHSAAGGVGQAAISVALWIGAKVFATVGNASKKDFLVEAFGISANHIFSSRLREFKAGVLRLTGGEGVDVVLNSLSGQMLQDSLSCVAKFGTFVELGKTDIHLGSKISMEAFDSSIIFASVDLSMVQRHKPAKAGQLIRNAIALISDGQLKLPTLKVTPLEELGSSFRTLQHRTHMGKIVADAGEHAMVLATPRVVKTTIPSDATFVVAGGRGGIGLEIGKYLARHGAEHIVLLSRSAVRPDEELELSNLFRGTEVRILSCDITSQNSIQENLLNTLRTMPPVRGVFQSTVVLRDRMLTDMDIQDFATCIAPKVEGTQNLLKALSSQPLQFFIMLSSVVGSTLGALGGANYAAANAFQTYLASTSEGSAIRFITICPGIVEDVGLLLDDEKGKNLLERQGFLTMKACEVIALLDYSLSDAAIEDGNNVIVSGFNYKSLSKNGRTDALKDPIFCHLPRATVTSLENSSGKSPEVIDISIANASTLEEAEAVIAHAIAMRLRTLVAHNEDEIDTRRRVGDLGVDSLVLVELKNWTSQTFQVKMQNNEIYDAPSIADLAALLAARSPLVTSKPESSTNLRAAKLTPKPGNAERSPIATSKIEDETVLPKQPLPDLDSSLDLWLTAVSAIVSDKDYMKAKGLVDELRKPGGQGRKLQARLAALASNPDVDNWQEELYNSYHYLRMRTPLVPLQNFANTHVCAKLHAPAERAAIIASACHRFYHQLEGGSILPQTDRGRKLDKSQYRWFFNTTREPRKGEDVMMQYPDNKYLVAFRRGRMFQVDLEVPFATLQSLFQTIIDSRCEPPSWVGVLTTDDRDLWAADRESLQNASAKNAEWLRKVEAAEFVLYLDDAKPATARERGHQFLQTGFNRWSDKTIQFAVCDNGYSGTIGEHSMIDGYAVRRLNAFIQDALQNHTNNAANGSLPDVTAPESFAFDTTAELEQRIVAARTELQKRAAGHECTAFETRAISSAFFGNYKVPAISGVQMAVQLASRKYFGYNPVAFETAGLAHFLKGRIECSHTVWPEVKRFCNAVHDETASKEALREMLFSAVKTHANCLLRSTQGYGVDRHLLSLEWSLREGEEVPEFFRSDVYQASRPKMLMTDCLEGGVHEAHYLPAYPGGFWVHFEVEGDRVRFSTWGKVGEMERWEEYIKEGAEIVRAILEG